MKEKINIVWLKRDLRTQDHQPLQFADDATIPFIIIYILEPSMIKRADWSLRHSQFVFSSIENMNKHLKKYSRSVDIFYDEALKVFEEIDRQFNIINVFSHAETGVKETWDRDDSVRKFFKFKNIYWKESQTNGVLRGINSRDGWDKNWYKNIKQPLIINKFSNNHIIQYQNPKPVPKELKYQISNYPSKFQEPGENKAWEQLNSFACNRSSEYLFNISNPSKSRHSCSRMSAHLAWGNISSKQCYQFIINHAHFDKNKRNFRAFLTRLKWRCHFMQKFEVENEYETRCINKGYELLEKSKNKEFISHWMDGKTGFPMVDASIRSVKETGWLNFRMRAMLVSFFCHHLDQDWRDGANFLARQFLDYEPGIHFPQFQMQAGTTGINTIRIYNPVKQSEDHDKEGVFIKKWIPELASCPTSSIHEPWNYYSTNDMFNENPNKATYINPIIDHKLQAANARKKMWGHRSNALVKSEKQRILMLHTRSSTFPR